MQIQCPICSASIVPHRLSCPQCKADLSAYLSVYYAPDMLYNEAVELAAEGDHRTAYDKLAAAHYLRPHDMEIVTAMAHCAEKKTDFQDAMEKLALALVKSQDPLLKQEYARLSALWEEAQVRERGFQEMSAELKALISAAAHEALKEVLQQGAATAHAEAPADNGDPSITHLPRD